MSEKKKGVKDTVEKMREMSAQGYDARQIGLSLIVPQCGNKVNAQRRRLSAAEKANQKLRSTFLRRKAKAKAKAQGKAKAKAKAKASPENSVEVVETPEPEPKWEDHMRTRS